MLPLCQILARWCLASSLNYISALYDVERELKTLSIDERLHIRQAKSKPLADAFHQWMLLQRRQITDGSATAKALDYSLKRWARSGNVPDADGPEIMKKHGTEEKMETTA